LSRVATTVAAQGPPGGRGEACRRRF
jgi:hypothetical protein